MSVSKGMDIIMGKLKIGDIFSIQTSKGNGYFQYVFNNKDIGELIRVFNNTLNEKLDIKKMVNSQNYYFIHFPLKAAYKQNIVKLIGNHDVPSSVKLPQKMRSKKVDNYGQFICWQIVDYNTWQNENKKELSSEEKKLSPWGIWNDTLLIERIEEEWDPTKWT